MMLIMNMIILSGCATIFSESSDEVKFISKPSGADIYIDGDKIGQTPFTMEFERTTFKHKKATIRKDGYKPKKFTLGKTIATAAIFNLTSVSSWATDATTGKMMEYSPKSYFIELEKVGTASNRMVDFDLVFVLFNYNKLMTDFARGHGEYFDSYLQTRSIGRKILRSRINNNFPLLLSAKNPFELYKKLRTI